MREHDTRTVSPSTAERIRNAAIAVIANVGPGRASARTVAREAGVSPALVIHHFGSMAGLRAACDDFVAGVIKDAKTAVFGGGPIAAVAADDLYGNLPLALYLARVLADDSPAVADLIDHLVADAEEYLAEGEEAGTVRPADDRRARAVVLTVWSLGALSLHTHVERLLGVDLTTADSGQSGRYGVAAADILGRGVLEPDFADRLAAQISPERTTT